MKTIREWLNELPEPYRSEALENCDEDMLESFEKTKTDAVYSSFSWERSPQGFPYWANLYKTL